MLICLYLLTPAAWKFKTLKAPPKVVTPQEAVACIPSHSRVYVHGAACTPQILLKALAERSDVKNLELCHLHLEGLDPCRDLTSHDRFFTNNFFIGKNERSHVESGHGSYIPIFLSDIGRLMRKGLVTPDVALLNVSPPDKHGYVTLGVEVATAYAAAETARILIAQINPLMPKTRGTTFLPLNAFNYVVQPCADPIQESVPGPMTPVEEKIGKLIASLVQDGATLQMGIGAIPNAVLSALTNHKNIGIHTEMFSDGLIKLIQSGVVNNSQKKYLPGRIITSFVVGSRKLYDFVDDNPAVVFQDASITNDPTIIGSNPKVTAINAAVEVDLTGQVCADSVGRYMISGVGGQVDFERGAAISNGGLPIICLPSVNAKNGSSRLVPTLREGAGVVTSRAHVHYVVTEYGIAHLFGKNLQQRAKALIDIAHPNHQASLEKAAFDRFHISAWRT
jgi:acyl-CoA hydrolase